MSEWNELLRIVAPCDSLYLREIGEPKRNTLRLVLAEGKVSSQVESLEFGGSRIENVRGVKVTADSLVIELAWQQYIAYAVMNESFSQPEGSEFDDSVRLLRRYSDSSFLAHISRATIATEEYPGHFEHVQVVSETHIVDVVSTELPSYRVLSRA